jgi:hypothetical protein
MTYRSPAPYIPYRDRSGETIADLIMRQGAVQAEGLRRSGDIQAARAARSGEIWGGAVANLGQVAAGALQQYGERQEQSKRSKAFEVAINSGDPKKIISVLGPRDGAAVVNALAAHAPNGMKKYADRMELFRDQARGVLAVPPENRAAAYKFAVDGLLKNGVLTPEEVPPYDESVLKQIASYGAEPAKGKGLTEVSPGASLYDPEKRETVFTAPKPPEAPKMHKVTVPGPGGAPMARLATEEELAAGVREYREPRQAPAAEPLVQVSIDGVATWVPRSQAVGKPAAQAARGATGQERTALGFFNRANKAIEDITPIEEKVAKYGFAEQRQLGYEGPGSNYVKTQEQQAYRQAQRSFTEARLRKESGAAIPPHEYENDSRTYFAQPGDDPATIEQKRNSRAVVLDGLRFGSGKAYDEYYGEAAPTPKNRGTVAPPAPPPTPPGSVTVTAPNGRVYTFPNKAEADAFRKRAGIR